jgi:hypothetical protein
MGGSFHVTREGRSHKKLRRTQSYIIFFRYNRNLMEEAPDFVQVLVASGLLSTTLPHKSVVPS